MEDNNVLLFLILKVNFKMYPNNFIHSINVIKRIFFFHILIQNFHFSYNCFRIRGMRREHYLTNDFTPLDIYSPASYRMVGYVERMMIRAMLISAIGNIVKATPF
jgi:hypothetical protein